MQEGSASPPRVTWAHNRELPRILHPLLLLRSQQGERSCTCRYIVRLKQGSDAQAVDTLCGDLESAGTTCTFKYGQVLVGFAAPVSPGGTFLSLPAVTCDHLNCSIHCHAGHTLARCCTALLGRGLFCCCLQLTPALVTSLQNASQVDYLVLDNQVVHQQALAPSSGGANYTACGSTSVYQESFRSHTTELPAGAASAARQKGVCR